ncbi:MAG: AAA family ATPase, partial [Okeania sp. SIO2H7]|nr:AAA family ATPase [Okeania sp. SIO2H7]
GPNGSGKSTVEKVDSLILLDEPEISLHPWALAVFAKAVKLAAKSWNKQIFIATHSPVLISQFEPENILAAELDEERQTVMKRVSEMEDIQDLLEDYATGSLYMAEAIAPQSKSMVEVNYGKIKVG